MTIQLFFDLRIPLSMNCASWSTSVLSSGMMGATYDSVDAYLDDATDSIKSITQQALLMQAGQVLEKTM